MNDTRLCQLCSKDISNHKFNLSAMCYKCKFLIGKEYRELQREARDQYRSERIKPVLLKKSKKGDMLIASYCK